MRGPWLGGLLGTLLLGACVGSGPSAAPAAFLEPGASVSPSALPAIAGASATTFPIAPPWEGPVASSPTPLRVEPTPVTVEPEPTPTPYSGSDPIPTPEPDVDLSIDWRESGALDEAEKLASWRIPAGEDHIDVTVHVATTGVTRSRCTLTHAFDPDHPDVEASTDALKPESSQVVALYDGFHRFGLACPSNAGTLRDEWEITARDNLPERCLGFEFAGGPLSSTTFNDLESGMIGTWAGCVTTPWVLPYWVDFTFRSDGTYSAVSPERLDGQEMNAMYYGTEEDTPNKRWALNDIQDSGKGVGQIDIAWAEHSGTTRDELRNIELMGDQLRFELFHMDVYGPLTFELHRSVGE
jgi:hypothetical protein